jgi:hypothetical protein
VVANLPAVQAVQLPPALDHVPRGHSKQDVEEDVEENPALQTRQAADPTVPVYFPWGHDWQVAEEFAPTAEEYLPAGHSEQALKDVAPTLEAKVPCGQLVQLEAPE